MNQQVVTLTRRTDYEEPAFFIRAAELAFDLDATETTVTSLLHIERHASCTQTVLRLDGEDLTLLSIRVDGRNVSARLEDGCLIVQKLPPGDFTVEIVSTCRPVDNAELSGLYVSDGGLYTQCEAEGFRRIAWFLDRPDVMAVYTVTLRADPARFPVLLSNGNRTDSGRCADGRHFAVWHDPFPKPSYLFALVADSLESRSRHIRTVSGQERLLEVYARGNDIHKTEHAMNSLVAAIRWDEERFGLELDLKRFMLVGVADFNAGAMENKGLNIFNTSALLASAQTATDIDFATIEAYVGHEYFHNWTGNRVTCRDWFQLSLKEGLTVFRHQEFSMDQSGTACARAVCRIRDVSLLRTQQFPEDSGSMAHAVRPESYAEINNFYTVTVYMKGAEVVRMMQTLVGEDGFRRGIALYFQRHDGQAATCDDFLAAMADANPKSPLAARRDVFARWYSQQGTPRIRAQGRYDANDRTYSLTLLQELQSGSDLSSTPMMVPVSMGLLGADGRALSLRLRGIDQVTEECVLVLDEAVRTFVFEDVDAEPVPSLFRGFSSPVILDDDLSESKRLFLVRHDVDAFNRWEAVQRLMREAIVSAVFEDRDRVLGPPLLEALETLLVDATLDSAFKALALTLPSETEVAEAFEVVQPMAIHAAVQSARLQLALSLRPRWTEVFRVNEVHGAYAPDPTSSGKRALRNLALAMLVLGSQSDIEDAWSTQAHAIVRGADNMTERLGALTALVDAHSPLAEPALAYFHSLFEHDALALEKWFAVQAGAPESMDLVITRAIHLSKHPDFDISNPNRARSLLGTLCLFNPSAFHRPDAQGYAFWATQVLAIDGANPQLAGRIARALDRWAVLAEPFRGAARCALEHVAEKKALSRNVREIVERALASAH